MKFPVLFSSLLAGVMLLSACGSAPASSDTAAESGSASLPGSTAESSESSSLPAPDFSDSDLVYRGTVAAVSQDSIEVAQLEGHNYGQESILFHMNAQTQINDNGFELAEGNYVEIIYSGILTRSIPPQGTADTINIISSFSDGIILNGMVLSTENIDEGFKLAVLPFENDQIPTEEQVQQAAPEDQIYLIVPFDAVKNMSTEDFDGALVSAVTRGIAAQSMPPQIPVYALLPYSGADSDACSDCL